MAKIDGATQIEDLSITNDQIAAAAGIEASKLDLTGAPGVTPLAGTKVYYVSDTSGGAVTRKLTFTNGILTSET